MSKSMKSFIAGTVSQYHLHLWLVCVTFAQINGLSLVVSSIYLEGVMLSYFNISIFVCVVSMPELFFPIITRSCTLLIYMLPLFTDCISVPEIISDMLTTSPLKSI